MSKLNCWEYKKCGREIGGVNAHKEGVCPAYTSVETNGINYGFNGGRVCWRVAGTMCVGEVQGSFALKLNSCMFCDFYLEEIQGHKIGP